MDGEQKRKTCSELSYYCNIWSGYRVLGLIKVTKARRFQAQKTFFTFSQTLSKTKKIKTTDTQCS